jgi:predicted CXXCH cytochrome family protein
MHPIINTLGKRVSRKALLIGLLGVTAIATLISCATVERTIIMPPHIEGATFVGDQNCAECHQNITKHFHTAEHAKLKAKGPNAQEMGCEACHGAGSVHAQSGGAKNTIINPKKNAEVCMTCHMDMKARFSMPHHHPVENGKVSCSDCHNPHKGPAVKGGGTSITGQSDTCMQCHVAQRGPFVFEHEAIREGCTTCHDPHGTVNDKMLVQRNQNLCLKCHFQAQTAPGVVMIGSRDHKDFLIQGTCWSAGCHEAVHGSHVSSSLRF